MCSRFLPLFFRFLKYLIVLFYKDRTTNQQNMVKRILALKFQPRFDEKWYAIWDLHKAIFKPVTRRLSGYLL